MLIINWKHGKHQKVNENDKILEKIVIVWTIFKNMNTVSEITLQKRATSNY